MVDEKEVVSVLLNESFHSVHNSRPIFSCMLLPILIISSLLFHSHSPSLSHTKRVFVQYFPSMVAHESLLSFNLLVMIVTGVSMGSGKKDGITAKVGMTCLSLSRHNYDIGDHANQKMTLDQVFSLKGGEL